MIAVHKHPLMGWIPDDTVVDEAAVLGLGPPIAQYRDDEVSTNPNGQTSVLEYHERVGIEYSKDAMRRRRAS